MDNKLQHWGVLGMKWGVRRYQNKDGTLTPDGVKKYQKIANRDANKIKSRKQLTEERVIPAGTKIYRTTSNINDSSDKTKYVSYLDIDRKHYNSGWIRTMGGTKSAYEHEYELTDELKIPSRKTVQDTIQKTVLNNKAYVTESVKGYIDMLFPKGSWDRIELEEYGNGDKGTGGVKKFTNHMIENLGKQDVTSASYSICQSLGLAPNVKKEIIKELSKKGYNAMADEASVGGQNSWGKEGYDPLIIFDSKVLKETKTRNINKREEKKSASEYDKWRRKAYTTDVEWSDLNDMSDYLKHWGVLGMKWGVRRYQKKDGSLTSDGKKRYEIEDSEDHTKKINLKKKKIREMTNDELKTLTKRMQLEKQYKELASNDISAGKKFVNGLINQAVKEAESYAMKQVSAKVEKMLKTKVAKK